MQKKQIVRWSKSHKNRILEGFSKISKIIVQKRGGSRMNNGTREVKVIKPTLGANAERKLRVAAYWLRAFIYLPQDLDHCCMPTLHMLFILRRNPQSGQRDPIWRALDWFWPKPKDLSRARTPKEMLPGGQWYFRNCGAAFPFWVCPLWVYHSWILRN